MKTLSPFQREAVLNSLREYGEMPMAAHAAAVTTGYLRRCISSDPEFADEVEHALGLFSSGLVLLAHSMIKDRSQGSVQLLQTLLTAKVEGFSPESRKQKTEATGRPTGLTLRQFDDEGNDTTSTSTPLLQLAAPTQTTTEVKSDRIF